MSEAPLDKQEESPEQIWGGVTDPAHHDPTHFRYLLHLDSGHNTAPIPEEATDEDWEYALNDLSLLRNRNYVSASLVDRAHPFLYQGSSSCHGFIIEAPKSAIIAAHSMDMYSKIKDTESLRTTYPAPDPEQLLAQTKTTDWNEVAVSPEGVTVRAIFWVDGQHADEEPSVKREKVKQAAAELGLPFLDLDLIKY